MDKKTAGFTLFELLTTLVLMAILLSFGIPSFLNLIEKMGTESETQTIIEGLRTARLIAIEEKSNIVVCPSSNGTSCGNSWDAGFIIYRDNDASQSKDADEEIIFTHEFKDSVTVKTGSGQNQSFFFNTSGWAAGSAESLLVCANASTNKNSFRIVINRAGRIRVEDWHVNWVNASGTALNC